MKRMKFSLLALLLAAMLIAGCSGSDSKSNNNPDQSGFVSAGAGDGSRDGAGGEYDDGAVNAPSGDQEDGDDAGREIVEADVFKVIDDTIYALNQHRGLAVIEMKNGGELEIIGRLKLEGFPEEMFVDNGVATILLTNFYEQGEDDENFREASKVVAVDIIDAQNPLIIEEYPMAGRIVDSRQVGDVVYVVSATSPWTSWCYEPGERSAGSSQIISINIANPGNIHQVDSLEFQGEGWAVYVTQNAMYVAQSINYSWYAEDEETMDRAVHYVDISDPAGEIVQRGSFQTNGYVFDRFKMYQQGETFAVVTGLNDWNTDSYFQTFDVSNPDDITPMSEPLLIMQDEELHASRFAENRAYIVTFRNTDPLFVIDFTNPAQPTILGELEIPGWSTHLEILGEKILGVGIDDQDGWRTKVSLFDVTDPTNPAELSALSLGSGYSWSEATADWKAFKVYEDLGLVLVPTSGYEEDYGAYVHQLNLIDYDGESLTKRGSVANDSPIKRGFRAGEYLASMSETSVQLIDYADRDNPEITGEARIASLVNDLHRCGEVLCNSGDGYYDSHARLQLFMPEDESEAPYWASEPVEQNFHDYYGMNRQILTRSGKAYILTSSYGYWMAPAMEDDRAEWIDRQALTLHGFDISDTEAPSVLGSAVLQNEEDASSDEYYGYTSHSAVMTDSGVLGSVGESWGNDSYGVSLSLYDISSLDSAALSHRIDDLNPLLPNFYGNPEWLTTKNNAIWAPMCENVGEDGEDRPLMKCYALKLDASTPSDIAEANKINIPGHFIGLSDDEAMLYSLDRQYGQLTEDGYYSCDYSLEILSRDGNTATRVRSVPLFSDEYCYWVDDYDYGDGNDSGGGSVPPSSGDGGSSDGSTSGDDEDPDMEEPAPTADEPRSRIIDEDDELEWYDSYAQVFVKNTKILVVRTQYQGYGYGYGYDDAVGVATDGGCGYDYVNQDSRLLIQVYDGQTGDLASEETLVGFSDVRPVDGGGLLAVQYNWRYYQNSYAFKYITENGDIVDIENPYEVTNNGGGFGYYHHYESSFQSVKIGNKLYIPFGWEGIMEVAL